MNKKIRKFERREDLEKRLDDYSLEHKEELLSNLLKEAGKAVGKEFKTLEDLKKFEFTGNDGWGGFGLDCGWMKVYPKNEEHKQEWKKDDKYHTGDYEMAYHCDKIYSTQSTTLQEIMLKDLLTRIGFNRYNCYTHLD